MAFFFDVNGTNIENILRQRLKCGLVSPEYDTLKTIHDLCQIAKEAMILAGKNRRGLDTLRAPVLSTDTTYALAFGLCTSTAPYETSVSSKEYAVSRSYLTHFLAICVVLLRKGAY